MDERFLPERTVWQYKGHGYKRKQTSNNGLDGPSKARRNWALRASRSRPVMESATASHTRGTGDLEQILRLLGRRRRVAT